ncbi:APC family permease [Mycoplasma tullyi]|uniref:APC family permease n=1 Tax=Mycoplasma tullyi TaxID=1612150 RepID=A0A7D7XX56_9MOLU|nr:APC family permease [Mycoplasma tullyi]QMT98693.1 APC family permease [Mycoplasma tullyi]
MNKKTFTNKKAFSDRTFALLTINYIVGFGFIATIAGVVNLGYWALLILFINTFIATATALAFSRLISAFPNETGGSISFAKKTNYKFLTALTGFHQYVQVPLFSATGPLFLVQIARVFTQDETHLWIVRGVSILFYIGLILIVFLRVKISKWFIFATAIIKWITLGIGFIGLVILVARENSNLVENFNNVKNVNAYLIFSTIIFFMFAYGGVETTPNLAKDVQFKKFSKALIISIVLIAFFYTIAYILFLNIKPDSIKDGFIQVYRSVMGLTGVGIFIIYLLFYNISSTMTSTLANPKVLVGFAQIGLLPKALTKTNRFNQHQNAIITNTVIIIVFMIFFTLLPAIAKLNTPFFSEVINMGTIAFLLQYLLTFVTIFILVKQKKMPNIKWYELAFYGLAGLFIVVPSIIYLFPFLVGEQWTINNTIVISVYAFFFAVFLTYFFVAKYKNRINLDAKLEEPQEEKVEENKVDVNQLNPNLNENKGTV